MCNTDIIASVLLLLLADVVGPGHDLAPAAAAAAVAAGRGRGSGDAGDGELAVHGHLEHAVGLLQDVVAVTILLLAPATLL